MNPCGKPIDGVNRHAACLLLLCLLIGSRLSASPELPIQVDALPLNVAGRVCSGHFVEHDLDHITTVSGGDDINMFEANGGGLAINDLNGDGKLDIVLANQAGKNTILWNQGDLQFTAQPMTIGDTRAVNIVDLDGDGKPDILLTRTATAPNYWRNLGNGQFEQDILPGVAAPLYAMTWVDLDGDGDLDLIGATYDAALLNSEGQNVLLSGNSGVFYYQNQGGNFPTVRVADHAQALALIPFDLDGDGKPEILVGNDFAVPDQAWKYSGGEWQLLTPFTQTTYSTMSFDYGDITNSGQYALFASDMKPYTDDSATHAAWASVIKSFRDEPVRKGDPQVHENVLEVPDASGHYVNESEARGVDATGWSWSGKFGDLNQDGYLDLFVVNGMIEGTTFANLPHHELVEEDQAFRNDGTGHFIPAPEWDLGSLESGRGMSMADLDSDGDLDIVINNLHGPAQLFENQLCEGSSIEADLFWPGSLNTRAIGATLILHTDHGDYRRDVRTSSGYLSGDPSRLHFGFPAGTVLNSLEIHWPDGSLSTVDPLKPDELLEITR